MIILYGNLASSHWIYTKKHVGTHVKNHANWAWHVHMWKNGRPSTHHNYLKYPSYEPDNVINRCSVIMPTMEKLLETLKILKLWEKSISVWKFPNLSFSIRIKTSPQPTPNYSSSRYILGIYALRVTYTISRRAPRPTKHMRQHGKIEYFTYRNWWFFSFSLVFLDFLIF